ncbi:MULTISPECIES: hypothetical protein [Cupriavidus]|jgi:hypothetical protein|uniref:Uncharacterized protein n=1 Tax=Cupriavidus campinensis TaxID=151783 RepID=A0ABY3EPB3_9BURK|nr:hypothetical protein [Cupriavidus campinensis]TSP12787.1 hypothetical protein FGG12_11325 [Cupriavidus campinensis]
MSKEKPSTNDFAHTLFLKRSPHDAQQSGKIATPGPVGFIITSPHFGQRYLKYINQTTTNTARKNITFPTILLYISTLEVMPEKRTNPTRMINLRLSLLNDTTEFSTSLLIIVGLYI